MGLGVLSASRVVLHHSLVGDDTNIIPSYIFYDRGQTNNELFAAAHLPLEQSDAERRELQTNRYLRREVIITCSNIALKSLPLRDLIQNSSSETCQHVHVIRENLLRKKKKDNLKPLCRKWETKWVSTLNVAQL